MKKTVVLSGVIAGVSVVIAVVSLLSVHFAFADDYPNKTTNGTSAYTTTHSKSMDGYWGSRLSQLLAEQSKKSTKAQTTGKTSRVTTTANGVTSARSKKTTLYVATTQKTTTTTSTTKKTTAATTTVLKTTRTATQEELKTLYDMAYYKVMSLYYQYQIDQRAYIADLETNIDNLRDRASDLYVQYMQDKKQLPLKFEAMGLSTNSGAYKAALEKLELQYKADLAPIEERIDELEVVLEQAKEDYALSANEAEELIRAEYLAAVEDFQQKTLS